VTSTWQRVSVTFTASTNPGFAIRPDTVSNLNIYIWGAQLAVGPLALDYTPTTTAAVYGPRFDFDGSGVTSVEPIATNLLLYSQEFDNAAWVKSGSTITANTTAAPDGTTTADTLTGNGVLGAHSILQVQAASADGKTFSVYLKAGTNNFAQIFFDNTGVPFANFDLSTGSLGSTGSSVTATITSAGDGWYRCVVYTSSSLATNPRIGLVTSSTAARSESNTLSTDIYLWGAQVELSATATAYMPSGATNGFRAVPVVTGSATARGLLIEEQRTNLLTYSEQFNDASWTKSNCTVTPNATTAPDGTVTADKLVSANAATDGRAFQTLTLTVNTYSLSVYAKAAEFNWVALSYGGSDCWFNLSVGAVGLQDAGVVGTITSAGSGWYRCSMSFTGTAVAATLRVYPTNADSTFSTGNGTSGIFIWGAQVEAGSFATSYIPTLASTVTRSADVASVNTLSPFFNATEGTMFAQFDSAASGTNTIAAFDDNTANENYRLRNVGTDPKFTVTDGGVDQCDINGGTIAANTVYNFAAAYKANDFAACIAGGTVQTDTSGTLPTVDRLRIGTSQAGNYLNGHVRRFAYYPRRLTNAEIQALTS
jgi:hypothetical protein